MIRGTWLRSERLSIGRQNEEKSISEKCGASSENLPYVPFTPQRPSPHFIASPQTSDQELWGSWADGRQAWRGLKSIIQRPKSEWFSCCRCVLCHYPMPLADNRVFTKQFYICVPIKTIIFWYDTCSILSTFQSCSLKLTLNFEAPHSSV